MFPKRPVDHHPLNGVALEPQRIRTFVIDYSPVVVKQGAIDVPKVIESNPTLPVPEIVKQTEDYGMSR